MNGGDLNFTTSLGASITSLSGNIALSCGSVASLGGLETQITSGTNGLTVSSGASLNLSSADGSDISGDGSYLNPYVTIQKAIDVVELGSDASNIGIINVAPGNYTQNLTFTKGYIGVLGTNCNARNTTEICEVTGRVQIDISGENDEAFVRQVILANLQIRENTDSSAALILDTSTKRHTLFLQNCYLYGKGTLLHQNSTTVDVPGGQPACVTRMTQVEVNQASSTGIVGPTLRFSRGTVYMESCDVTTKQDTHSMLVDASATISRCALSQFTNVFDSSGGAIVRITNNLLHTFGSCAFVATSGTVYGIRTDVSGSFGTSGLNLVQNSFLVTGVATNAVNNIGYVYSSSNGSYPGLASGYTIPGLRFSYAAM